MVNPQLALLLAQNTDHIQRIQDKFLAILDTVANKVVLPIGSGLIIIALILAGFRYMQGDPKGGKSALIAAITGLLIVLLSFVIIYQIVVPAVKGGGGNQAAAATVTV